MVWAETQEPEAVVYRQALAVAAGKQVLVVVADTQAEAEEPAAAERVALQAELQAAGSLALFQYFQFLLFQPAAYYSHRTHRN